MQILMNDKFTEHRCTNLEKSVKLKQLKERGWATLQENQYIV